MYDERGKPLSIGSGFFVSRDGMIATNYHVIEKGYGAVIATLDGKTYKEIYILSQDKDMDIAISAMEILKKLDEEYLKENKVIIGKSKAIVFDTNLEESVLRYGVNLFKDNMLYLDTVSYTKALRAKEIIGFFDTIKPNRLEAEALSGILIKDENDLNLAAERFHRQGVRNVFITLGEDGVFYSDNENRGIVKTAKVILKNATGAGDAFQAALVHATLEGMNIREKIKFSMGASIVAMDSDDTINKEISVQKINQMHLLHR